MTRYIYSVIFIISNVLIYGNVIERYGNILRKYTRCPII